MQGHSAANLRTRKGAANRIGEERQSHVQKMQDRVLPLFSTVHLLSPTAVERSRYPWKTGR